jgi:hypothetical protein
MKKALQLLSLLALVSSGALYLRGQFPPVAPANPNPWNGSWRLDVKRSSPIASEEGVPQVYRLTLGPAGPSEVPIRWEIPELGEIVNGRTDGKPMDIHRTHPTPGLTLAVRTDGSRALSYQVFMNGKLSGGGRMMLVDAGKAWVDLTWPSDRQDLASELTYVKE